MTPIDRTPLEIAYLETVESLRSRLLYIETSDNRTQVRNVCQLMLLRNFHEEMLKKYAIRGGVRLLLVYEIIRIEADICEGLLYALQTKQLGHKPEGKISLESLINYAKTVHEPRVLLSRNTRHALEVVLKIRNNLHADKQTQLHTKLVGDLRDDTERAALVVYAHRHIIGDINAFYAMK